MKISKTTLLKKKDWFRIKQYPHIGLLNEPKDRVWIEPYVNNPRKIAKHGFFPFIHRKLQVRKFRKAKNDDGSRSKLRNPSYKEREVYYSCHLDSSIYGYYAELLSKKYNELLLEKGIENCVTAYRQIKTDPKSINSRNKYNIDFANDIFNYITLSKGTNLVAITFDIKSFFDSLNHKKLKIYWRQVINSGKDLPSDHYNIYRNITKFSFIDENDLFYALNNKILVERNPDIIKERKIKKKKYLRNQRAIAYCYKEDINFLRDINIIKSNKYVFTKGINQGLREKGIPQGSPISAVLANIYMLGFDTDANKLLASLGGMYKRYSDDMVAICKPEDEGKIIDFFQVALRDYCLEIQPTKTQIFHFLYNEKQ